MDERVAASVIIPTFNREGLIAEAVLSAVRQEFAEPLEVIVVDDGSQDGTAAVVKGLQTSCPNLGYLWQPNRGPSAARNAGFAACRGEFIQFLDSDDLLHPGKIARQLEALRANPEAGLATCLTRVFVGDVNEPGEILNKALAGRCEILPTALQEGLCDLGAPLYRRATVSASGPWNTELRWLEDLEWHVRVGLSGFRFVHVDEVLFFRRYHDAPRLSAAFIGHRKEFLPLYERYLDAVRDDLEQAGKAVRPYANIVASQYLTAAFWNLREGSIEGAEPCYQKALAMSAGAGRRLLWQATWTLVGVIGPKRAIRCWDHLAEKGFRGAGDRFLRR